MRPELRRDDATVNTFRYLPGLSSLVHYRRAWLRGDVLAGVTVSAYLVPQVMAYAEVAGLPAIHGLWAVVGPLAVYAVLGSSRQLSVGPESTTALMTATALGAMMIGNPGRYAEAAAALAIAVGLICLLGWCGRLGFLANLLSGPVLTGYMAGIAILMVVSQLSKLTGVDVDGSSTLGEITDFVRHLDEVDPATVTVSGGALVSLLVIHHWIPRVPGPLVVMLGSAALVAIFDLSSRGIATIGAVPMGLPLPAAPNVEGLAVLTLLPAAVGVAVVGYTDNVLTARAFAAHHAEHVDNGQEFLALGAANIAAGLGHGFPVSSSGSRTVIADTAGARSQAYSLVALAVVLLTLVALGPVLSAFPTAALGAIVVFAAVRLIDVAELRRIGRFRRSELSLSLLTMIAVLAVGVLYGVAIAVVLSVLDLLRRIAKPHDGILGYVPGVAGMHDVDDYANATQVPGLVVYRYDSPLFFANAEDFKRRALDAAANAEQPVHWFVINAEANVEVDLTAVDALDEVRTILQAQGAIFALARVKHELRETLTAAGFIDRLGEDRIFMTLPTAVQAYRDWYLARHGRPPAGLER
jgi:sulfate permease, SulP family